MKKIFNEDQLKKFAQEIAAKLHGGEVFGLVGDLGAGKTTFVQALAKALGVHGRITSPTFVLMNVYARKDQRPVTRDQLVRKIGTAKNSQLSTLSSRLSFVHIDAYRLSNPQSLLDIGAGEYFGDPQSIVVVEWADRVKTILPRSTRWIRFEHGKESDRRIITLNNAAA